MPKAVDIAKKTRSPWLIIFLQIAGYANDRRVARIVVSELCITSAEFVEGASLYPFLMTL